MNTEDDEFARIEREQALDKMANNAKELGLDYEPPLYTFKQSSAPVFAFDTKPNHNMTFHRDGKQIGVLDFNGPEMVFEGDAAESAKVFIEWVAKTFKARLDQERADEREVSVNAMARIVMTPTLTHGALVKLSDVVNAIRTRGNT